MEDMSNKRVSIIVVAYNPENGLRTSLESIRKQSHKNLEIIVIGNSMLPTEIENSFPEVKFIQNQNNLFYCQGLNKGINTSSGNFTLCLNDDVILDDRFIEEALKGFEIAERIGMVSGKILRMDRKTIDSTGIFLSVWRTAKERGYGKTDKGQYDKEGYIFGVNGAVAFYRRQMLEEIKIGLEYFDSDFRMFYEDIDIAWRANRLGWKGYYMPKTIAYHVRGKSARIEEGIDKSCARRYLDDNLHFDLFKNRYLTMIKNESLFGFMLHLPFIIFYDISVWLYFFLFRRSMIKKVLLSAIPFESAWAKRFKP